jgi:RND superfamily putative drug exporter
VSVLAVRTAGSRTVGGLTVPDPTSDQARSVVRTLQGRKAGTDPIWVTGQAAFVNDFLDDVRSRAPLAAGVVVLATFVLLFLLTGSVLVPVKALVLVVVSLGASFGVLVRGFQEGGLERALSFDSTGGIETAIPVLIVALGFGLSMDYEVFLLSRIKELRDGGLTNDEAVAQGLQRSGRIITSAALVIVVVFLGFAAGELLVIKETGIGLAVTVAIDATLVRLVLVPATMTVLGEWNWWAPAPLRRLHARIGMSEV